LEQEEVEEEVVDVEEDEEVKHPVLILLSITT
jgi:hypothetical protein